VSAPARILVDRLLGDLQRLCAQPSSAGQGRELAGTANIIADLLRQAGFSTKTVRTAGAPVVLGRRAGRSPFTLLLYHHYDVAPTGPWRAWFHEPFQLAEREEVLFGRGVAHGKGPLIAHLQALRALQEAEGELPCGIVIVVEGEGLAGSPHLDEVVARHKEFLRADACLGSAGERDVHKRPFCYSGSKGLLHVELSVSGMTHPLLPGLAASVRNPAWQLVWALGHIKGEDEDIRINGFYDEVEGPNRNENASLRKTRLDEAGRLMDWEMSEFLFGMSGVALVRAETTLPTCNLSSFTVEPPGDLPNIPTAASARLDFQLVPAQHPDTIINLVCEQLIARGSLDIKVERLPGGYPPTRTEPEHPFVQHVCAAGIPVCGEPFILLPLGPFTQPLHTFADHLGTPVAVVALKRNDSAVHGPNERLPLEDLLRHGQLLMELSSACAGQTSSVGQGSTSTQ